MFSLNRSPPHFWQSNLPKDICSQNVNLICIFCHGNLHLYQITCIDLHFALQAFHQQLARIRNQFHHKIGCKVVFLQTGGKWFSEMKIKKNVISWRVSVSVFLLGLLPNTSLSRANIELLGGDNIKLQLVPLAVQKREPEAQKPGWQGGIATRKVLARPESFCA